MIEIFSEFSRENYHEQFEGVGIEIDPAEIQFGLDKGLKIIKGFVTLTMYAIEKLV